MYSGEACWPKAPEILPHPAPRGALSLAKPRRVLPCEAPLLGPGRHHLPGPGGCGALSAPSQRSLKTWQSGGCGAARGGRGPIMNVTSAWSPGVPAPPATSPGPSTGQVPPSHPRVTAPCHPPRAPALPPAPSSHPCLCLSPGSAFRVRDSSRHLHAHFLVGCAGRGYQTSPYTPRRRELCLLIQVGPDFDQRWVSEVVPFASPRPQV